MSNIGPIRRLIEEPIDGDHARARVAQLLRQLPKVTPLSPVQLSRIETRIEEEIEGRARGVQPSRAVLAAACALSLVLAAAQLWRRPAPPARAPAVALAQDPATRHAGATERIIREISVPEGGLTWLSGDDSLRAVLMGPGAARLSEQGALLLRGGRLAVKTGSREVTVEAPDMRVLVRAGSVVEVEVHQLAAVRVAAFTGSAVVEWQGRAQPVQLAGGVSLEPGGLAPIDPTDRRRIERLFSLTLPAAAPPAATRPRERATAPGANTGGRPAQQVAAAPGPRPDSELMAESRLLESALRKLQIERDPAEALRLLDTHKARHPQGSLTPEARTARVLSLVALERREEALAELEHDHQLGPMKGDDLLVLRGELRASSGRCGDAMADFTAALARPVAEDLIERALYGRASCRALKGDAVGARADLRRYLARFPDGRFSDAARDAIGK